MDNNQNSSQNSSQNIPAVGQLEGAQQPVAQVSQQQPSQNSLPVFPQTQQSLPSSGVASQAQPVSAPIGNSQDKPMQELVDQVERDLLAHIYTNLKENKLTGVAAQQLAQEFLTLLPFKDKKDLVDKLSALGQKYPEARETYVNLGIPLEEQQRQERLDQMRTHIKSGDIDKALEVAKGGK